MYACVGVLPGHGLRGAQVLMAIRDAAPGTARSFSFLEMHSTRVKYSPFQPSPERADYSKPQPLGPLAELRQVQSSFNSWHSHCPRAPSRKPRVRTDPSEPPEHQELPPSFPPFQIYTRREQIIFLFRDQSVSLCHLPW